ncbi:MAG: ribosomal protein L24, partial [Planctomycetota bacterium]
RKVMEAPIHISNVMPWSEKEDKGVRVRFQGEGKAKVRVSTKTGEPLAAAPAASTPDDEKDADA